MLPFSVRNSAPSFCKPADVQIHRPVADGASARQAHDRLAALGQQRPQHANARPHRLDDVVLRFALASRPELRYPAARSAPAPPASRDWPAHADRHRQPSSPMSLVIESMSEKPRHPFERAFSLGHEARRHDRQRGILAAADFDCPLKATPAVDEKAVHLCPSLGRKNRRQQPTAIFP